MAKAFLLVAYAIMATLLPCALTYPSTYAFEQAQELAVCKNERDVLARKLEAWKWLMRSMKAEVLAEALEDRTHRDSNIRLQDSMKAIKPIEDSQLISRETNMGPKAQGEDFHFLAEKTREESVDSAIDRNKERVENNKNGEQSDKKSTSNDKEDSLMTKLQELSDLLSPENK